MKLLPAKKRGKIRFFPVFEVCFILPLHCVMFSSGTECCFCSRASSMIKATVRKDDRGKRERKNEKRIP